MHFHYQKAGVNGDSIRITEKLLKSFMNKNGERGVGGGGGRGRSCPMMPIKEREMRKFFPRLAIIKTKLQHSVCICLHVHANNATSHLQ